MKATIYNLPNCVQCNQTKKLMDREGVAYDVVKLEENPDLMAAFKEEGILQAPIVVVGNDGVLDGLLPDEIMKLKAHVSGRIRVSSGVVQGISDNGTARGTKTPLSPDSVNRSCVAGARDKTQR